MRFAHGMGDTELIISFYILRDGRPLQFPAASFHWEYDDEYLTIHARAQTYKDILVRIFA